MDLISSSKKSSRLGAVLPIRLGWLSGWLLCQQETDLSAFKRGAYVGFGAFGYVQIAKHKASGQICAIKAM